MVGARDGAKVGLDEGAIEGASKVGAVDGAYEVGDVEGTALGDADWVGAHEPALCRYRQLAPS